MCVKTLKGFFSKSWAFIKALSERMMSVKAIERVLVFVWALIILAIIVLSVNFRYLSYCGLANYNHEHNYAEIWSVGAITSVFIFSVAFNFINIHLFKKHVAASVIKDSLGGYSGIIILNGVILLVCGAYVFLNFLLFEQIELHWFESWKQYYLQQSIQVFLVMMLTWFDWTLLKAFKKTKEIETDPEKIQELNHIIIKVLNTLRFVDFPSVIAFILMLAYYSFLGGNFDEHFPVFIGGAEAFALVSFNITYIIIIFEEDCKKIFK